MPLDPPVNQVKRFDRTTKRIISAKAMVTMAR